MERYKVRKNGENTFKVFDTKRNCSIVTTISPNAKYNEEVINEIVMLLNKPANGQSKIV